MIRSHTNAKSVGNYIYRKKNYLKEFLVGYHSEECAGSPHFTFTMSLLMDSHSKHLTLMVSV
jgi:hypothetical protein